MNEVVYDQNGVVVRSWPVKHVIDGPVNYSLEWNGLKFVYGGDCAPNKYFMEYAKGADIAIHECFIPVELLMEKFGFPYDLAVTVGTRLHTSPAAWASVMKEVQPRLAIAYHFYNDPGTAPLVFKAILDVYDGPIHLTKDNYVYNVTHDNLTIRQLINTADTWPKPHSIGNPGTRGPVYPMSDWPSESEVKFPCIDEYPDVPEF